MADSHHFENNCIYIPGANRPISVT